MSVGIGMRRGLIGPFGLVVLSVIGGARLFVRRKTINGSESLVYSKVEFLSVRFSSVRFLSVIKICLKY